MEILIDENIYNNVDLLELDLQGWNSKNNIFEELILKTTPKIIVEVGSWKGGSAIHMANLLKKHNLKDTKIICIDTWLGWNGLIQLKELHNPTHMDFSIPSKNGYPLLYQQFLSNIIHTNNQKFILPLPMTSLDGAKYIKCFMNKYLPDLIYIDACHDFFECYNDIKNYYQTLKMGGYMFGDDYSEDFSGTKLAYDNFCHENGFNKNTKDNFWILNK